MAKLKVLRLLVPAVLLVGSGVGASTAAASAANPPQAAQVEISANCDNPSFPLCAQPPDGIGLGGVWTWAALDTDGGAATAANPSPMDATVAFCGHQTVGEPNGAFGHPDLFGVWYRIDSLDQMPAAGIPFFDVGALLASGYTGGYYVLDFFPGSGQDDFIEVVPASAGHYAMKPAPGVSIETQVAQ